MVKIVSAGIIAGILVDLFLFLTHSASFPAIYQYIAFGLIGSIAYSSATYTALGVLIHLLISVIWAYIYVWVFQRFLPRLAWFVKGAIFGVVVMLGMQVVLLAKHLEPALPAGGVLIVMLVAHVLFFGLPIAYMLRTET